MTMSSVSEWNHQFRFVRVHHEHRKKLGRLRLAGSGGLALNVRARWRQPRQGRSTAVDHVGLQSPHEDVVGAGWKMLCDIDERHARGEPRRQIAGLLKCRMHVGRGVGIDENASECAHAPYDRTQP